MPDQAIPLGRNQSKAHPSLDQGHPPEPECLRRTTNLTNIPQWILDSNHHPLLQNLFLSTLSPPEKMATHPPSQATHWHVAKSRPWPSPVNSTLQYILNSFTFLSPTITTTTVFKKIKQNRSGLCLHRAYILRGEISNKQFKLNHICIWGIWQRSGYK